MKPFDLEAAKRGEPIQTRDGVPVKFIAHVPETVDSLGVVMLIDGVVVTTHEDGWFHKDKIPSSLDLFMAPRKRTVWVNLYPEWEAEVYEHQYRADKWADEGGLDRIGNRAWPLEIEE